MPENKNFEFTNYFTQTNKLVPKNYVEVTQEEGTQEPSKFKAQLFYPTTKESGVIDQGRSYVADKSNRGRWNATRTKNAEMQQRLFELGAYGEGANQDKVVDGLMGNQTRAALAKAEELGYMYDQNSNVFRKNLLNLNQLQKVVRLLKNVWIQELKELQMLLVHHVIILQYHKLLVKLYLV